MTAVRAETVSETATDQVPEKLDPYTDCFLNELSVLEKRDVRNSTAEFSRNKAFKALVACAPVKAQMSDEIAAKLANDPNYTDPNHRRIATENELAMVELPLLLLIHAKGK